MHRYAPWIAVAVVVVVLLIIGLRPQATLVETSIVKTAGLVVSVEEEGQTRVVNRYEIFSPVAGYIRRVNFDVGDRVEKSQELVELEPLPSDVLDPRRRAEAEARVAGAKSALLAAEQKVNAAAADQEYAKSEYQRKQSLRKTHAVSEEQLQQAHTSLQRSEAELRSARFAVEIAKYDLEAAKTLLKYSAATPRESVAEHDDQLETVVIRSPINGSILKILRKSEGVVTAGEPLLELGNPQDLEVIVDVLSEDAVRIQVGTAVKLKRWGGVELDAQVKRIEPVAFKEVSALGVDEQRVLVVVDIHSPMEQWTRLGDGYRVDASFVLWQGDQVLQVPESSLFRDGNQWAVYVVEDDEAQLRHVEVGQRNGLEAQILSGVTEGEVIILYPDDDVKDGSSVRVRS